jgi:hypothetical protein
MWSDGWGEEITLDEAKGRRGSFGGLCSRRYGCGYDGGKHSGNVPGLSRLTG